LQRISEENSGDSTSNTYSTGLCSDRSLFAGKDSAKVIVNLHEGGFAAYVAASRARMREGLCITRPVSLQHLNKWIPTDLLLEVSQFDALEHDSLVAYGYRKGEPVVVPDAESEMGHGHRILMAHFEEEKEVCSRGNKCGSMSVSDGGDEFEQPMAK